MAQSFAVVCEGPADQRTGCDLADRVVCEQIDWVSPETLHHHREWRGFGAADSFLPWANVRQLAAKHNVRSHGFFDGQPAAHDAHAARKALLLLGLSESPVHAVILLRDEDGDPLRRKGLEQARHRSNLEKRIAIGVAVPARESWVLAGFKPHGKEETDRLAELRRELGFDPCVKAEELTARSRGRGPKKNAKRVLRVLTRGDLRREAKCWRMTDLQTLAAYGERSGLADYLGEIRDRLVSLLTARGQDS